MSSNLPQIGQFYYHFKHNPEIDPNDYAYKILAVATHTETDELLVIYQALYTNKSKEGRIFNARPLTMFQEIVTKPEFNYIGPRFRLIEDPEIIKKLQNL